MGEASKVCEEGISRDISTHLAQRLAVNILGAVTQGSDDLPLPQNKAAGGAVLAVCQTMGGAGGVIALIRNYAVSCSGNNLLCCKNLTADGAIAACCQAAFRAGSRAERKLHHGMSHSGFVQGLFISTGSAGVGGNLSLRRAHINIIKGYGSQLVRVDALKIAKLEAQGGKLGVACRVNSLNGIIQNHKAVCCKLLGGDGDCV